MDTLSSIVAWLSDHEAAIGAVVGITVLAGIVFAGLRSLVRRRGEAAQEKAPAGSIEAPSSIAARHRGHFTLLSYHTKPGKALNL